MRPKVVVSVLLFGVLTVAAVLLLWFKNGEAPGPSSQPPAEQAAEAGTAGGDTVAAVKSRAASAEAKPAAMNPAQGAADANDPVTASPEAKHQAYVETRVAELRDLGTADDSDSLNDILSELGNREPEIRKAALEAAVQFGSRDAIPKLQDAELQADDPHERAAIADAIEFLQLPTISEMRAQNTAQPKSNP